MLSLKVLYFLQAHFNDKAKLNSQRKYAYQAIASLQDVDRLIAVVASTLWMGLVRAALVIQKTQADITFMYVMFISKFIVTLCWTDRILLPKAPRLN